jgi:rhodanese-related sulfurtransferase
MVTSGARTGRLLLVLCLAALAPLGGCGGGSPPSSAPAPIAQKAAADPDIRRILSGFLADLPANWHQISPQDLATSRPVVVDVRQPEEYASGFIGGAVNIALRELAANLSALPAMDGDIVLVCESGYRSAVGMAVLRMVGYKNVRSLEGGMKAWRQAKLSTVTTPVPARPAGAAPPVDARLQTLFDYYLTHTLPIDWGAMSPVELIEDQKRKSSTELEAQPETFDQGRSVLVDVDDPAEFRKAALDKAINVPLRELPEVLDTIPLEQNIHWA